MGHTSNPRLGLRLAALLWIVCSLLPAGTALLAQQQWGTLTIMPSDVLAFGACVSALLFGASFFAPLKQERVLPSYMVMGIGFGSFLFLTAGVAGAFLLAPTLSTPSKLIGSALIVVSATLWCLKSLSNFRHRVINRKFVEREFSIHDDQIVLHHPIRTDLDAPLSEQTFWGKVYYGIGPYLALAVPVAYPVQRLLTDTGGLTSLLLLLSVLCIPLTLHILGRMSCGGYLWIYKVWQMERRHGKPVVFSATTD